MEKTKNDRRGALRHDVRTRIGLRLKGRGAYENAHLMNLGRDGLYIMARRKMSVGARIEIRIPAESPAEDDIHIQAEVIRVGNHRYWGLFSYGCRVTAFPFA
ncbi:MAG: PilZ domain-containing protein [Gammaproteobacteria bacterium]|nr:PilZ domain-containing protein [Gammaproteobacteria bacterium]